MNVMNEAYWYEWQHTRGASLRHGYEHGYEHGCENGK
jgi:hypothetical protein